MNMIQKSLLLRIMEEALDQPKPTNGLRNAIRLYEGFEAGRIITARAKNAARVRIYQAKHGHT